LLDELLLEEEALEELLGVGVGIDVALDEVEGYEW